MRVTNHCRPWITIAFVMAVLAPSAARASDCSDAVESYNRAINDLSYGLRRHSTCLNGSRGTDDCNSEFRRVRNAQSDFETAVSNHRSYCP